MTNPMVPPGPPPPPNQPPVDFNAAYHSYDVRFPEQRPAPSQAMAGWALGLSFVPGASPLFLITTVVSVVLAIVVLVRCRDGRNHGKKKAIAALVIVAVRIALTVVVITVFLNKDADRDDSGNVTSTGSTSANKIRSGDCLVEGIGDGEVAFMVDVTPCSKPHKAEVLADFELDGSYDADRTPDLAEKGCLNRLRGTVRSDAKGGIFLLYPQSSAAFALDKTVSCLYQQETTYTGSIRRKNG